MPGLRQQKQNAPIELIEDFLADREDEIDAVTEKLQATSKRSSGKYFRKIERLLEDKKLQDDISDYDWDD